MRTNHDRGCPWYYNWHECSCGYLEEELRTQYRHDMINCTNYIEGGMPCEDCTVKEAKPITVDLYNKLSELVKNVDIDLNKKLTEE